MATSWTLKAVASGAVWLSHTIAKLSVVLVTMAGLTSVSAWVWVPAAAAS
jgi:hypothetical protein